ncbi:MAG: tol-pal system protein YbgF [Pseudomonadota bacterium]
MQKLIPIVLAIWSSTTLAQVPVVEAGTSSRAQASAAAPTSGGNEVIVTMYNQLEALQQEVQTLRGRVEEQDYQIKRMQTEQRDRYLDIDRRLSSTSQVAPTGVTPLTGPAPSTGAPPQTAIPTASSPVAPAGNIAMPPQATSPNTGVATNTPPNQGSQTAAPIRTNPATTSAPAPQMDEQELYRTALNLLLEQSNYEQSIQYFQTYITSYPKGRYLTNSYYWQGEAYILVGKFSDAKDAFTRIITEFPQDPKAAGAMLKLGVAYEEMGDREQARKTWQDIAARYPESTTEIREAESHLRGQ